MSLSTRDKKRRKIALDNDDPLLEPYQNMILNLSFKPFKKFTGGNRWCT